MGDLVSNSPKPHDTAYFTFQTGPELTARGSPLTCSNGVVSIHDASSQTEEKPKRSVRDTRVENAGRIGYLHAASACFGQVDWVSPDAETRNEFQIWEAVS